MGADIPLPQKYDERRRPTNGRPRGVSSTVFRELDSKKIFPARRGPDEAAERSHQRWDISGTIVTTNTNPDEIT